MVIIVCLSASEIGVTHEAEAFPLISTVQARHCPSPQPYFVPVSCKSSRSTSSNGRCGSEEKVRDCPLTVRVNLEFIRRVWFNVSRAGVRSAPANMANHAITVSSLVSAGNRIIWRRLHLDPSHPYHQGGADLRFASEGILWMPIRYGERNRRVRKPQTGGLAHRLCTAA